MLILEMFREATQTSWASMIIFLICLSGFFITGTGFILSGVKLLQRQKALPDKSEVDDVRL